MGLIKLASKCFENRLAHSAENTNILYLQQQPQQLSDNAENAKSVEAGITTSAVTNCEW